MRPPEIAFARNASYLRLGDVLRLIVRAVRVPESGSGLDGVLVGCDAGTVNGALARPGRRDSPGRHLVHCRAMPLTLDDAVAPSDDVVFRELDGEAVLLNLETGIYFGLDAVGTRVWQLAVEHGSLRAVKDGLLREFDADDPVVEQDLLRIGEALIDKGLWVRASDTA